MIDYFSLVGLLLPEIFILISPICVMITVIFVYHKLEGDNELSVLKSSGWSNKNLFMPAFKVGMLFFFISLISSNILVPKSLELFKETQHRLRYEFSSFLLKPGAFCEHKNTTIYVKNFEITGEVNDIFIVTKNKKTKSDVVITAKKGEVMRVDNNYVLKLINGVKYEDSSPSSTIKFEELIYKLSPKDSDKKITKRPFELSTFMLVKSYFESGKNIYLTQINQRIIIPLLNLIFALIAMFFFFHKRISDKKVKSYSMAIISSIFLYSMFFLSIKLGLKRLAYIFGFYIFLISISIYLYSYLKKEKSQKSKNLEKI